MKFAQNIRTKAYGNKQTLNEFLTLTKYHRKSREKREREKEIEKRRANLHCNIRNDFLNKLL